MQARDWRWKSAGSATSDGACLALSVQWIIALATASDFFDWLGASKIATGQAPAGEDVRTQDYTLGLAKAGEPVIRIHQLMATQKQILGDAHIALGDVEKFKFVAATLEEKAGLKAQGIVDILDSDGRSPANLESWVKCLSEEPGYKYISIGGFREVDTRPSFQHGIAAWISGTDSYKLFDPNFGEFGGLKANFAGDLTAILRTSYRLFIQSAQFMAFA